LIPIQTNLIDILWGEKRPNLPNEQIWKHDLQYSGFSITDKLSKVRLKMNEYQVNHLIVHRTDDVACKNIHFIFENL
jgi:Xaa-Pro aminopeptidase